MHNHPVIIIGAGRSGTNMLRDSLCSIEGFETWPCDEINYIWRHGNVQHPSDRFTEVQARSEVKKFIRRAFEKQEKASTARYVVEKTCANSLKIPFINAVFPEARYIFIVRDGRDAASSAMKRWKASLDISYILTKVRYVPVSDMPYYGLRYFVNRLKKLASREKRLAFWGPLYPGMMDDLKKDTLLEVCAKQWRECVKTAESDFSRLDQNRVHKIQYESFVRDPVRKMKEMIHFTGAEIPDNAVEKSVANVVPNHVGKFKKELSVEDLRRLHAIVEPVMADW
ncbi:MAG TPA: sulfotransferase [Deltaproteobacteria bacterium]|nr:sulfotransferase [Deltaproteobacteria bacterium]